MTPERILSGRQELERLYQAIARLPGPCRSVFVMRKFDDKPQKAIAAELQISENTVEKRMSRALRMILEHLQARSAKEVENGSSPDRPLSVKERRDAWKAARTRSRQRRRGGSLESTEASPRTKQPHSRNGWPQTLDARAPSPAAQAAWVHAGSRPGVSRTHSELRESRAAPELGALRCRGHGGGARRHSDGLATVIRSWPGKAIPKLIWRPRSAKSAACPSPTRSRITLDTSSRVSVRYESAARLVRLESGTALFEVAKDPGRPFVVQAGHTRVRGRLVLAFHRAPPVGGRCRSHGYRRHGRCLARDEYSRAGTVRLELPATTHSDHTAGKL